MGAPWLWSAVLLGAAAMLAVVSPGRTPPSARHTVTMLGWDREDHRAVRTTAYAVALSNCRELERQVRALRDAGDARIAVSCLAVDRAAARSGTGHSDGNG
jgi:hypothetical protein